jgi:hypothetical protein
MCVIYQKHTNNFPSVLTKKLFSSFAGGGGHFFLLKIAKYII